MGDFGVFVRGTSISELDGALVIETSDEAASGALHRGARAAREDAGGQPRRQVGPLTAPGGGKGFTLGAPTFRSRSTSSRRDGRVVFAYGDAAAKDAVDPAQTLGDSAEFAATRDSLGNYDVSFYMLMQPIIELADRPARRATAHWQKREALPRGDQRARGRHLRLG